MAIRIRDYNLHKHKWLTLYNRDILIWTNKQIHLDSTSGYR